MKLRAANALELLALAFACLTLAWGPLVQGSTSSWGMSGLILLGSSTLAMTLVALGVRGEVRVPHPWWVLAALAFLVWVWASTTWAPYKMEAYRWAGVWTAVLGTAVSLHLLVSTRARQAAVLTALVLTAAAALALAYLQTRGVFVPGFQYYPGTGPKLVTGPYYNPSHFSGYLIPVAALLTSLILFTRPHLHTLALAGLLVALHWMNLKTDASSIPAVLLATALPFLVWAWTKSKIVGATLSTLAVGAAVAGALFFISPQGQTLFALHKQQLGLANSWQRFVVVRKAVWRYGEEMSQQHLLKGVGIGQFFYESPQFRAPERSVGTGMDAKAVNYAHNDYLQIMSELGLVGLALFLMVALTPLSRPTATLPFVLWPPALLALAFTGVYDGHLTVLPGTFLTAFALCGLAASLNSYHSSINKMSESHTRHLYNSRND